MRTDVAILERPGTYILVRISLRILIFLVQQTCKKKYQMGEFKAFDCFFRKENKYSETQKCRVVSSIMDTDYMLWMGLVTQSKNFVAQRRTSKVQI